MRKIILSLFLLLGVLALPAFAQTTQVTTIQGTVVTFSGSHTTGTYADGSPWINVGVGTTTITDKSPKDVDGMGSTLHGCMVNIDPPNPTSISSAHGMAFPQGFDSRMFSNTYVAASNFCASFPSATLSAGKSIIVAESLASCTTLNGKEQCVEAYDVITTVSSNPSAGQFRPPFAGTDKSLTLNKANIRYDVLKDNALVTGQPTLATLEAEHVLESIFFTPATGAQQLENLLPTSNYNTPGWSSVGYAYGRPMNNKMQDVLMALHSNATNAAKETMAIRVVQNAIDIYGMFNYGTWWVASGALCPESQSMLLVGASLINNQAMMDIGSNTTYPNRWCSYHRFKYITAEDVTPGGLARDPTCGSNTTETTRCAPFTSDMIGRPAHNDQYWTIQPAKGTALPNTAYAWFNSALIGYAMAIRWMSLEEEMAAPYFIDYMYGTTSVAGATPWPDGRWSNYAINSWYAQGCSTNAINTNSFRAYLCLVYTNYRNSTPIDGSVTGSSAPNVGPTSTLVSPSSSTTQFVTGATIVLAGTSADSDGTVSSTTATSTCDGSISNSGSATSWSFTVDLLAARSSCTVSIVAMDDDGDVAPTITVSVLRHLAACTTFVDAFSLGGVGTWPTLDPCWVAMNGSLSWSNNRANASSSARNFVYYNAAINNDQQVTMTLGTTPVSGSSWVYGLLRASGTTPSTYSAMGCTAENPTSTIATFVNGNRVLKHSISMTGNEWVGGDVFTCQVIGQVYCILKNNVQVGTCFTDTNSTFTTGFAGFGLWGNGNNADDFAATAAAGGGDITPPEVAITTPSGPIQVSATPYTALAGTASDNDTIVVCTWFVAENPTETGDCDTAMLPDNDFVWTANSIDLISGNNTLTVRVFDDAGNSATTSQVVNYAPAAAVVGTITYPAGVVGDSWTQVGKVADIGGTFTAGQCTSVLLTNVSDPNPEVGGNQVTAAGTDTWTARVKLVKGANVIEIDCLDAMGESLLDEPLVRTINSLAVKRRL